MSVVNRRDFMKVGGVAGAGTIVAGHVANNYATAGERVSECVAIVITATAEMLRIVRDYRLDLTGFDAAQAAAILRTIAFELDRAAAKRDA